MKAVNCDFACRWIRFQLPRWVVAWMLLGSAIVAHAQEAEWIWSTDQADQNVPKNQDCYFRRVFNLKRPEAGTITIAADDTFELYVNGRMLGTGSGTKKLVEHDITKLLAVGQNVVAVKATNKSGNTAAMCARVLVKESGGKWLSYSTNKQWKVSFKTAPLWNTIAYTDRDWAGAHAFGKLGETAPWDVSDESNLEELQNGQRFTVDDEFEVQRVLDGEVTGSVIAMTFNEFGQIVVSREGGPLMLLYDDNKDKLIDKSRVLCDKVTSCQGLLCLNGEMFVTGDGPEGAALYRLTDKNRDGVFETVKSIVKFEGEPGEHGAHGVALGPDGLLYVVLGNHTKAKGNIDPESPYRQTYEGDLNQPRYEDPGGHAVGVKAPGGTVIRTDTEGTAIQVVAGGLRNAYDLTFNRDGEMFIPDSDMESDEGSPWYRPTRVYHIVPGGEYGWRSGWANWPDYYVDVVPPLLNNGRGSPAGITTYNHFMFPQRFHGAVFMADWSAGQIVAIKLKPNGGSYKAESSVLVSGSPLNVTDLEVGPDGNLYFVTGGRGTSGGLYCVKWRGKVPDSITNIGEGITAIIRQPQFQSAFARQNIALWKRQLGTKWDKNILGVATSSANPPDYRLQALDLMQLYGPTPNEELLLNLSKESNEKVRAKAVELMGSHPSPATHARLLELLNDSDRYVRRKTCEALLRAGQTASLAALEKSLASDDRFEAWAARRLLEHLPPDQWAEKALTSKNHRVLIQGALALAIAHPDKEITLDSLQALADSLSEFVSDRDFLDMLRVMQVALHRANIKPEEIAGLREVLKEEFPAGDAMINRELIRVLVYLQEMSNLDRYLAYLKSDAPDADRAHVGMHLRYLKNGWTADQRLELLEFYESAQHMKAGNAFTRYLIHVTRDFAANLTEEESRLVLEHGAEWPNAALGALYKMPKKPDAALLKLLIDLDNELKEPLESAQRLKVGIIAVLAMSGDPAAMKHLRTVWEEEPERRQAVAMGLSLHAQEENWPYLIRSLPILEANAVGMVVSRLIESDEAPEEPEPYRNVILLGFRLKEKGADQIVTLLEHWTGDKQEGENWEAKLKGWQAWYLKQYPNAMPAEPPAENAQAKWKFEELIEFVVKADGVSGDAERGLSVFSKAQCAKCHRSNNIGIAVGPDLTTLSKRFTKKEILESIYYPSHVVSDQYAAKTVELTNGKVYTGIVAPGASGEILITQNDGEKVLLKKSVIEEITPSKISVMPSNLLDPLSKEEIVDLMAYLINPTRVNVANEPSGAKKR